MNMMILRTRRNSKKEFLKQKLENKKDLGKPKNAESLTDGIEYLGKIFIIHPMHVSMAFATVLLLQARLLFLQTKLEYVIYSIL